MAMLHCKVFGAACLLVFVFPSLPIVRGLSTQPSHSYVYVDIEGNATLPCPEYNGVIDMDHTFYFVRWYIWSSNGIVSSWKWFAGMNQFGVTNARAKGSVNISRADGSLYIDKAQPCDVKKFMCKVERINGRSPKTHFVTLRLREHGNQTKTSTGQKKDDKPKDYKRKEDSHHTQKGISIVTGILAFLAFAEGCVIAYLQRSHLQAAFRRCIRREEIQAPD